jgi:hypothetical protein
VVAFFLIVAGCAGGWWYYVDQVLPKEEARLSHRRFAEEIRLRAPAPQLILFFRAEAHGLAFRVGPQIETLLEWQNLDAWAARPDMYLVVMPPEEAREWPRHLKAGRLEEVLPNTALVSDHNQPLVLLRTMPALR